MAVCLGCGSRRASVIYSRTVKVLVVVPGGPEILRRECWRIVVCRACGSKRRQTVHDEGETRHSKIQPVGDEVPSS